MVVSFVGHGVLTVCSYSYGHWFHALVLATRIRKEKTKLVKKFAKVVSERMISGMVVNLLREIAAEIMGVVVEMKDSLCILLLSRAIQLVGARLLPGEFVPSVTP